MFCARAFSIVDGSLAEKLMDKKAVPEGRTETKSKGFQGRAKLIILALAVIGLIVHSQTVDLQGMLTRALDEMENSGWVGVVVFAVL